MAISIFNLRPFMTSFFVPQNILKISSNEREIRAENLRIFEEDQDLLLHVQVISSTMQTLDHFSRKYKHETEEQLVLQFLGIKLFNELCSSFKLLVSGYYHASASLQRNMLETIFLLDYFSTDKSLILEWNKADEKKLKTKFSPFAIRVALDDRDKFKGERRKEAYNLLCKLAVHPTNLGFAMFKPSKGELAFCGAFFDEGNSKAVLEELVKHAIQATNQFAPFFALKTREDYEVKIACIKNNLAWTKKVFNVDYEQGLLEEFEALAKEKL